MVAQLIIFGAETPLAGSIPVPGDEDMALARMGLAALSRGKTTLAFRGEQGKIRAFLDFLTLVSIRAGYQDGVIEIQGSGLFGIEPSAHIIDLRGNVDVAGLALGLLVSRPFRSALLVDDLVVEHLVPALCESHAMQTTAAEGGGHLIELLPLSGGARAPGISVAVPGNFPWVKRALLLAGLRASGPTLVEERFASADHLERAMTRARMPIDVQGTVAVLHPPRDDDSVAPQIFDAVGSTPFASALLGAALMRAGSEITLRDIVTNPTRSDFYSVARHMGTQLAIAPLGDRQGEPFGNVSVRAGGLRGVQLGGETAVRMGDDVIPLFALAARATGMSQFTDLVAARRGGDAKIWGRVAGLLAMAGVRVEHGAGGMSVTGTGGRPFAAIRTTTGGDSRLAILATLLALGSRERSVIDDVDCLAADFPRWSGSLRALGVKLEVKHDV